MTFRENDIPCYHCSDRYIGCHGKCERYTSFTLKNEEERKKRFAEKELEVAHIEQSLKRAKKIGKTTKNSGY